MHTLFISGQEIILVLVLALIFFGAKSIPEIAKMFGKGVREFRKASEEIQREFNESTGDLKRGIQDMDRSLKDESRKVEEKINHSIED